MLNQQPSTSKQSLTEVQIQTSSPNKKQITSPNLPILPQITSLLAKKNDSRTSQTLVNQLPIAPILPMTTITQIPSVQNKQSVISQQPTTSKHPEISVTPLPSVTKQLISLPVSSI